MGTGWTLQLAGPPTTFPPCQFTASPRLPASSLPHPSLCSHFMEKIKGIRQGLSYPHTPKSTHHMELLSLLRQQMNCPPIPSNLLKDSVPAITHSHALPECPQGVCKHAVFSPLTDPSLDPCIILQLPPPFSAPIYRKTSQKGSQHLPSSPPFSSGSSSIKRSCHLSRV